MAEVTLVLSRIRCQPRNILGDSGKRYFPSHSAGTEFESPYSHRRQRHTKLSRVPEKS